MELYEKRKRWRREKVKTTSEPQSVSTAVVVPKSTALVVIPQNASPVLQEACEKQAALAQIYHQSVIEIVNSAPTELSIQKQEEVLALVDEWHDEYEKNSNEARKILTGDDLSQYNNFMDAYSKNYLVLKKALWTFFGILDKAGRLLGKSVVGLAKLSWKVGKGLLKVLTSKAFFNFAENVFGIFAGVLATKLASSVLTAVAKSGPLSAIVFENSDLITNIAKSTYKAIKDTTLEISDNLKAAAKDKQAKELATTKKMLDKYKKKETDVMKLTNIKQLKRNTSTPAFLPNGKEAVLYPTKEAGKEVVKIVYNDLTSEVYDLSEFEKMMQAGINIFSEPSQKIMEAYKGTNKMKIQENKIEAMNRLDCIARGHKDTAIRQEALSLLDAIGLGCDRRKEVEALFKKLDAERKQRKEMEENTKEITMTRSARLNALNEELNALLIEADEPAVEPKRYVLNIFLGEDDVDQEEFDDLMEATKRYNSLLDGTKTIELVDTKHDEVIAHNMGYVNESEEAKEESVIDIFAKEMQREPYFETAKGVMNIEPREKTIIIGGLTNGGVIPEYEFDYDFDHSLDWNLQGMIEQVMEAEGWPIDEAVEDEPQVEIPVAEITDVQDVDLPDALADTIPVTDEGEVLTVEKVQDEVEEVKDAVADVAADIEAVKDAVADIQQAAIADAEEQDGIKNDVEELEDKVDDAEDAIEDIVEEPTADTEEVEEIIEEPTEDEEGFEATEEPEIEDEEIIEESFKSFLREGSLKTSKFEDLNQTKKEIDKMTQQGKDPSKIKDAIAVMTADDKEKEEAEKYAAEKLTESLLQNSSKGILSSLIKK